MELSKYLDTLTQANHYAGGGSVASLNGALASSLIIKALNMVKKTNPKITEELRENFENDLLNYQRFFEIGIEEDGKIFGNVLEAWRLPKNTRDEKRYREDISQKALKSAVNSPFIIMKKSVELFDYIFELSKYTDDMINTEIIVSRHQIVSAYNSAIINFAINLKYIKEQDYKNDILKKVDILQKQFDKFLERFDSEIK